MIIQENDTYIKACMQVWLFCESRICAEETVASPRSNLLSECHDCAAACFALVCQLISNPFDIQESALTCILHCRQCEEECEKYSSVEDIRQLGDTCHDCAEMMMELAVPYYLN